MGQTVGRVRRRGTGNSAGRGDGDAGAHHSVASSAVHTHGVGGPGAIPRGRAARSRRTPGATAGRSRSAPGARVRPALPDRLRHESRGLERRARARRARPHPPAGQARGTRKPPSSGTDRTPRSTSKRSSTSPRLGPVLRVEDATRAVAWSGRLGFVKEWEHQFEPGFPGSSPWLGATSASTCPSTTATLGPTP